METQEKYYLADLGIRHAVLGYRDNDIASALGLNPRAIYPIRKNAAHFDITELMEKLYALSELDYAIKTGTVDKYRGLELFLMRI